MADFEINDHILRKECDALAAEIVAEFKSELAEGETLDDKRDEMTDRAHEAVDGHAWVIYNYKALLICAHCDVAYGEEWLDDTGFEWKSGESTIYTVAASIVYGEMLRLVELAIDELVTESEPA